MAKTHTIPKTISVCLPVYNREKTIARALASVMKQSYMPNEVVICNFASTDNSAGIIDKWVLENRSKITIIYHRFDFAPQGVNDWNKTIELASGDLISILEGDDSLPVDFLKTAMESFQTPSIGLTIFPGFNEKGRKAWSLTGEKTGDEMIRHFADLQFIAPPSQAVFSRLDNDHKPFLYNDVTYRYAPEMDLYFRIMKNGRNACIRNNPAVYRGIGSRKRILPLYYTDHFNFLEMLARSGEINLVGALKTFTKFSLNLHARAIVRFVDGSRLGYLSDLATLTQESISFLLKMSKLFIIKFRHVSTK